MSMHCAAAAAAAHRPHVVQALQAAADCGSSNVTVSRAALLLLHREVGCHFTQEIMSYMHSNSLRQREDLNFHDVLNFCCLLLRLLLCNLDPATGAATLPSRRQQGPATHSLVCFLIRLGGKFYRADLKFPNLNVKLPNCHHDMQTFPTSLKARR